jgi:putative cell wall-binding protein
MRRSAAGWLRTAIPVIVLGVVLTTLMLLGTVALRSAGVVCAATAGCPNPPGPPAYGPAAGSVYRLAGPDRYRTAAAVSMDQWSPGVYGLFVASGENFPDGLAAAAAAGARGIPLLLVRRDSIPAEIAAELERLDPGWIWVIGGTSVVSLAVEQALAAYTSGEVERLWGADRYATAVAISERLFSATEEVFIATGTSFPDALVGSAAAGYLEAPLLLVKRDTIPSVVVQDLERLIPQKIIILGGTGVISSQVEAALQAYAPDVTRIGGVDRYDTAVKISEATFTFGSQRVYVVTGKNFPDALVACAAAGDWNSPVLLVPGTSLPDPVATEVTRLDPDSAVVVGGTSAVSPAVEQALIPLVGP